MVIDEIGRIQFGSADFLAGDPCSEFESGGEAACLCFADAGIVGVFCNGQAAEFQKAAIFFEQVPGDVDHVFTGQA